MRAISYFLGTLLALSHITCAAPIEANEGILQRGSAEKTEATKDTSSNPGVPISEVAVANTIAIRKDTEQAEDASSDSMNNPGVLIRGDTTKPTSEAVTSSTPNIPGVII